MSDFKKQLDSVTESLLNCDNEIMVWAEEMDNPQLLAHVASVMIKAAAALGEVYALTDQKLEFDMNVEAHSLHPNDFDELAAIAAEFESSSDPFLQKQATVIDQLIINFAQRSLKAEAESAEEAELAKLRAEYRTKAREKCYNEPREIHERDIKSADAVKAIKNQITEYRPMETSLSTRYCPDHPGSQVRRVGDYTYQCGLDKKIYNWQEGFTTHKGNKVPGSDVSRQTQHLGDRALEEMHFSTRENRLAANASEEDGALVKKAQDEAQSPEKEIADIF